MKLIAKQFWVLSLVLSLLLGGTLANAHSYGHLDGHHHAHSDGTEHQGLHSEFWLNQLIHADGDSEDELDCRLSYLGSVQTVLGDALLFDAISPSDHQQAPIHCVRCCAALRLRPPSRAPPSLS